MTCTPDERDVVYELLAQERRRAALRYLVERPDGTTTIDHLARELAEESDLEHGSNDHVDQRKIELHHAHLPKLDESGVIAYDELTGTIRYNPDRCIEAELERFDE